MTDVTSRRNLILTPRVVGVVTGLLLLISLGSYLTGNVSRTFADLGVTAAALLAAVNCALAARSASGRLRVAWAGLAGATLSWAVGEAIWSWYELILHQPGPFPGWADVGYLGFPLGAVIAVALIHISEPTRRTPISYA